MTTSVQSSTAVQDLARSLMQTFDKNADNQLGADEFNDFLGQLLGGIKTASGTLTAGTGAAAGTQLQTLSRGGVDNKHLFEGFNFDREQLVEKSAKDAFAMLAGKSGSVPPTKSEAEAWFNQNIKAGMEELGHKVEWVKGDKFQFNNWQGSFVVDFVRGADGPNPAFWWGADAAGAALT